MTRKFGIYFIACWLCIAICLVSCEKKDVSPDKPILDTGQTTASLDTGTLTGIKISPNVGWKPSYFQMEGKIFAGLGAVGFPPTSGAHKKWYRYDIQGNQWQEMRDFSGEKRIARASCAFQGKGYLIGGTDSYQVLVGGTMEPVRKVFNDFWQYDPQTDEWIEKRVPPFTQIILDQPVPSFNMMLTSNKMFAIEGGKLWEYLPEEDNWSTITTTLPSEIKQGFNTQTNVGYVLSKDSTLWEYNPVSNQWRSMVKINEAYGLFIINNKLYTGGADPANQGQGGDIWHTYYLWEYDLVTKIKRRLLSVPPYSQSNYTGLYLNIVASDNEEGYFSIDYRTYSRYMYKFTP